MPRYGDVEETEFSDMEEFEISPEEIGEEEAIGDFEDEVESFGEEGLLEGDDGEWEDEWEDEDEDEYEDEGDEFLPALAALAPMAIKFAPMIMSALGSLFKEDEEDEDDFASDTAEEMAATRVPGLTESEDALAEHLIAEAAAAEGELEAAALSGAATAVASGKLPTKVKKVLPVIVKKQVKVTRVLRKTRGGRKIIPVQNAITKKAVATLVRKAKKGKPIKKATAARVLRKQAKKILKKPKAVAIVVKRNRVKRKKLNRSAIARAERFAL